MSKLFLGIDGGGTKTGFALADETGKILHYIEKGTIHAKQVAIEDIKKTIEDGLKELLEATGHSRDELTFTFAGVPGYGEFKDIIEKVQNLMDEIFGQGNYKLGNDCVAGWAGSQACKPGVNMVLGTGAIAYGMDYQGNEERSSGWGPYCGDDGSAYWIAREGIRLFGKEADGRVEKSHLYDLIKKEYKLDQDFDFISIILDMNDNRTEVAKLSQVVSEAAKLGDKEAEKIIDQVAYEVDIAVKAVINKLSFKDGERIYVTYSGGVFKMGEILKDKIKKLLEEDPRIEIMDSILSPTQGSCLMAIKASGQEVTDEIIERLRG